MVVLDPLLFLRARKAVSGLLWSCTMTAVKDYESAAEHEGEYADSDDDSHFCGVVQVRWLIVIQVNTHDLSPVRSRIRSVRIENSVNDMSNPITDKEIATRDPGIIHPDHSIHAHGDGYIDAGRGLEA